MMLTVINGRRPALFHQPPETPRRPGRGTDLVEALLAYELYASWWADRIPFRWAQRLAARYFAWKVARKFERYRSKIEPAWEAGW